MCYFFFVKLHSLTLSTVLYCKLHSATGVQPVCLNFHYTHSQKSSDSTICSVWSLQFIIVKALFHSSQPFLCKTFLSSGPFHDLVCMNHNSKYPPHHSKQSCSSSVTPGLHPPPPLYKPQGNPSRALETHCGDYWDRRRQTHREDTSCKCRSGIYRSSVFAMPDFNLVFNAGCTSLHLKSVCGRKTFVWFCQGAVTLS